MTNFTNAPKIYESLIAIQSSVQTLVKAGETKTGHRYKFATRDDLYAMMRPIMSENGVIMMASVEDTQRETVTTKNGGTAIVSLVSVTITFYASDGSNISIGAVGEAVDNSDKGVQKALGAAVKYALINTFLIEQGDEEADANSNAINRNTSQPPRTQQPAPSENVEYTDALEMAVILPDKNNNPYISMGGVNIFSRDPFRKLFTNDIAYGGHDWMTVKLDGLKHGDYKLPDPVRIKYVVDDNFKKPLAIQRIKTGQVIEVK